MLQCCRKLWQLLAAARGRSGGQRVCAMVCSPHISGCSAEGITRLDLRAYLQWGCGSHDMLPCCGGMVALACGQQAQYTPSVSICACLACLLGCAVLHLLAF